MVVPVMLLGIAAGQYRIFERLEEKKQSILRFTAAALLISIAGLMYQYHYVPPGPFGIFAGGVDENTYMFLSIGIMVGPVITALYAGILLLLLQHRMFQKVLSPLKSYGRMALTNYIFQTVFIYIAGNSFQLYGQISYLQSLIVCVIIYLIQLVFSVIWLRFFRFGPLEWLWRSITYLQVQPMRKQVKDIAA